MERLRITGTDLQSPLTVVYEQKKPKSLYAETDMFINPQDAESTYSRGKNLELMAYLQSPLGGIFAGIGLRLIADTNPNTLQEFAQRPLFFLGATCLAAGAILVKRALDAVDKYNLARIKLDKVKELRDSFSIKKEEIVYKEPLLPKMAEKVIEKQEQLTLDDELAYVEIKNKSEALRNITSKEPVKRIRSAAEQKAPAIQVKEKTIEPPIVEAKERKPRIKTSVRTSKAKAPERSTKIAVRKRPTKTTLVAEQAPQKTTVEKQEIIKQDQVRSFVIDGKRIYLREFGGIPYHKCAEKKCVVCREKLIFI